MEDTILIDFESNTIPSRIDNSKQSDVQANQDGDDLLSLVDYGSHSFWEKRYMEMMTRGHEEYYDWYEGFNLLKPYIDLFITSENKGKSRILNLGCGNSILGEEIWKNGYGEVQNIDYSASVIAYMTKNFTKKFKDVDNSKPKCEYKEMDAKELKFEDNSFDLVIDKDAFFCGGETDENITSTLCEASRVLKRGGVYLCISYGAPAQRESKLLCKKQNPPNWKLENTFIITGGNLDTYVYALRKN